MTGQLRPPFPYYGGKQTLAERIVSVLPEHGHYVEPYAGSLAVLLAKPRAVHETVNDLDEDLANFWRVLRDQPDELSRVCALTPHSRGEHRSVMDAAARPAPDPVERARRTFVLLTQGQSGGTARRTGWRYFAGPQRSSFSMPEYLAAYCGRIAPVVDRLAGVSLECRPALDVIGSYGQHPGVLLYVDPPYVTSTRKGVGYRHEMTDEDHRSLADALRRCAAAVVLSGYPSGLYDLDLYPDWHRLEIPSGTGNGGQWRDRVEVLWSNRPFPAPEPDLFASLDEEASA